MELLVLLSIVIKAAASVLAIVSQSLISRFGSVELYGEFSFFMTITAVFFWLFFAGVMKLNNKYLSKGTSLTSFYRKYFLKYVAIVSFGWFAVSIVLGRYIGVLSGIIGLLYLYVMSTSSTCLSFRQYYPSLIGEYLVGRATIIIVVLVLIVTNSMCFETLAIGYAIQYSSMAVYFFLCSKTKKFKESKSALKSPDTEDGGLSGIAKRFVIFQTTEIGHTVIVESSIIIQYLYAGGYDTALVSIVMIVRKMINFITGPTSKLYQPEFSRAYSSGDIGALKSVYRRITGLQMCIMIPVSVFLITQARLLLGLFNPELVDYDFLIQYTTLVFLTMVIFGPLSNFLSMVGTEKEDSISNWLSIIVMFGSMALLHESRYFVVIGFCAQILFSTFFKLFVFVKHMGGLPISISRYCIVFSIAAGMSAVIFMSGCNIPLTIVLCFVLSFIVIGFVYTKDELKDLMQKVRRHS